MCACMNFLIGWHMTWKVHFISFTLLEPGFNMKVLFFNGNLLQKWHFLFFSVYTYAWWKFFLEYCFRKIIYCVNAKDELESCCLEVEWNDIQNLGRCFLILGMFFVTGQYGMHVLTPGYNMGTLGWLRHRMHMSLLSKCVVIQTKSSFLSFGSP